MMPAVYILFANLVLVLFNITNSYIDAYKIQLALKNNVAKTIKHGINFAAYAVALGASIWLFKMHTWPATVYVCSAFFSRQITFDIPLNWRRGLSWDYVSLDRPPKALMDRIEVRIFGYNGRAPAIVYGVMWLITLTIQFFI